MPDSNTHIFRASLRARLYRDIEIVSTMSLHELGAAIVRAFGFDFDHAFGFYSKLTGSYYQSPERYELFADLEGGESDAASVAGTTVAQAFPAIRKKMLFLFDYGDEWRFSVELISLGQKIPRSRYPKILASVGTAPLQYPPLEDDKC